MEVSITENSGASVVTVNGHIDSSNAKDFETPLTELVNKGTTRIVLDMAGVDYMSSAGMRTIVTIMKLLKEKSGALKLASITNNVRGTLLVMGTGLFDIHDTVDQALGSF